MSLLHYQQKKYNVNYSCNFCNKSYKTKSNLRKHNLLCEIIHNTSTKKNKPTLIVQKRKNERDDTDEDLSQDQNYDVLNTDENEEVLPSPRQMYSIVCELSSKYTQLQDKLDKLSGFIQDKKKKMNVKSWLNTNVLPNKQFNKELFQLITIESSDVHSITSQGGKFFDMLYLIFSRVFYQKEDPIPMFALTQKTNTIYVYDQDQQWHELTNDKLIYMLNIVHFNCVKALSAWNKRNIETKSRKEIEMLADQYSKALIELMGVSFKKELTLNKIKANMYDNIKKDMKALLQVELEF